MKRSKGFSVYRNRITKPHIFMHRAGPWIVETRSDIRIFDRFKEACDFANWIKSRVVKLARDAE